MFRRVQLRAWRRARGCLLSTARWGLLRYGSTRGVDGSNTVGQMKEGVHAELDSLIRDLARIARLAGRMMTDASIALHQASWGLAEVVISARDEVAELCHDTGQRCFAMLQSSVPADLPMVVVALRTMGDLKRMCDLAQHIAKIARMKNLQVSVPGDVRPVFARMGVLAAGLAEDAAMVIENRDGWSCEQLSEVDAEVDALRSRIFEILFSENWSHGVEPAVDAALVGRYYERFADHAVSIARQVRFLKVGLPPT